MTDNMYDCTIQCYYHDLDFVLQMCGVYFVFPFYFIVPWYRIDACILGLLHSTTLNGSYGWTIISVRYIKAAKR